MIDPSRLSHLRKIQAQWRLNLDRLEEQHAMYGELAVPIAILNEEERLKRNLARIGREIALIEPSLEGEVQIATLNNNDEEMMVLTQAVQSVQLSITEFRRQIHVVTLGLGQRTVELENDLKALAKRLETTTAERTAWEHQESTARQCGQERRLWWQRRLAALMLVLIVAVLIVGWRFTR